MVWQMSKARWDLVESPSRFRFLIAHDLFGKPLRTFPDHAPALGSGRSPPCFGSHTRPAAPILSKAATPWIKERLPGRNNHDASAVLINRARSELM